MKLRKSDKLWENYCRIVQVRDGLISTNIDEYGELNIIAWKVLEKYLEAITKEFLK